MNAGQLYPYRIAPKMAPAIWGGDALAKHYGKAVDPAEKTGESWECWDENRILNGPLAGSTIAELRTRLGARLMGPLDPTHLFPILTKIIDARDALSVQVHPDDAYAQRVEHQRNGKTECWYILNAQPDAELVLGWTKQTDREEYERRVADGTLGDILRRVPVHRGEAYYIPAGSLHAIGAGIVLFETQQASDLTYRIFDWNRVDAQGKSRQLHVAKAADVLDFEPSHAAALETLTYLRDGLERTLLIAAENFAVERLQTRTGAGTLAGAGRPYAIMALNEPIRLCAADGTETALGAFETALVPAALGDIEIQSDAPEAEAMLTTPDPDLLALRESAATGGLTSIEIDRFFDQFV